MWWAGVSKAADFLMKRNLVSKNNTILQLRSANLMTLAFQIYFSKRGLSIISKGVVTNALWENPKT